MRQIAAQELRFHKFSEDSVRISSRTHDGHPKNSAGDIETLLLTGGTGFIGGAVLAEIIDTPLFAQTLMLVRAASVEEGRRRIANSIARFFPGRDVMADIKSEQILLAGLEDISSLEDDPRLRAVTHVIHSAAVTSFANHPRIRVINVEASENFVRLLQKVSPIRRFMNVGTAWCVGMGAGNVIWEGGGQQTDAHVVPYTRSKIEFEQLVRTKYPQFPLISARPSIVVGHSKLGTAPSASIYWVFRAAQILGSFTCRFDDKQDVVPADWVAQALVHLTCKRDLWFDEYHLSAGQFACSTIGQLDLAIAQGREMPARGREGFSSVTPRELPKLVYANREKFGDVNPVLLAKALSIYANFAQSGVIFDNSRTLLEGVSPPPPFYTYADECARTSETACLAAQMEDDFK